MNVVDGPFIADLRRVVGPRDVLTEPLELLAYECDGLPHLHQQPAVVVLPTSVSQVQEVVRLCHRREIAFVARGHGSVSPGLNVAGSASVGDSSEACGYAQ